LHAILIFVESAEIRGICHLGTKSKIEKNEKIQFIFLLVFSAAAGSVNAPSTASVRTYNILFSGLLLFKTLQEYNELVKID